MFGSPVRTFGGQTLHHLAALDLRLSKVGLIKHGDAVIGHRARAKLVKSRVGPSGGDADFDLLFDRGSNRGRDAFDCALGLGLAEFDGREYQIEGKSLGERRGDAVRVLNGDSERLDALVGKIRGLLQERFPPPKRPS